MILRVDIVAALSLMVSLNVLGVWMARLKDNYIVPVTVYLGVVSIGIATVWGALIGESFVTYSLPNGVVAWVLCTQLYDVVHESFVKRKDRWVGLWHRIVGLFTRKKKEVNG